MTDDELIAQKFLVAKNYHQFFAWDCLCLHFGFTTQSFLSLFTSYQQAKIQEIRNYLEAHFPEN